MFSNYAQTKNTLIYQRAKLLKSSKDGMPVMGSGDAKAQLELAKVALIDVMMSEQEKNNKATQYFLEKTYKYVTLAAQPRVRGYKGLNESEAQQACDIEAGIFHRVSKSCLSIRA